MPLYVAGAKMLENYPVGPLGGVAFNVTLMSYLGSLDVGINIDEAAVESPALLRDCLDEAFREVGSYAPVHESHSDVPPPVTKKTIRRWWKRSR